MLLTSVLEPQSIIDCAHGAQQLCRVLRQHKGEFVHICRFINYRTLCCRDRDNTALGRGRRAQNAISVIIKLQCYCNLCLLWFTNCDATGEESLIKLLKKQTLGQQCTKVFVCCKQTPLPSISLCLSLLAFPWFYLPQQLVWVETL